MDIFRETVGLGGELDLFKMEYQSRVSALQKAELQSPMAALGRLFTLVDCRKPDIYRKANYPDANNWSSQDLMDTHSLCLYGGFERFRADAVQVRVPA